MCGAFRGDHNKKKEIWQMKKLTRFISLLLMSLICFSTVGCSQNFTTITLVDNQALLTNPNMGWNFNYYSNTFELFNNYIDQGDYLDDFPCDLLCFRVGWSYWEPEEGEYDWERFESVLRPWWERGKRVILGFVVTHPGAQNTPLWVKEKGAEGKMCYWDRGIKDYSVETGTTYDLDDPNIYLSYSDYDVNQNGRLDPDEEDPNGDGHLDATWQCPSKTALCDEVGATAEVYDYARNLKGTISYDPNWNNGEEIPDGEYWNYRPTWLVNYDDEVLLDCLDNFLEAVAERYDNHPGVEMINICSLGSWGEGNETGTSIIRVNATATRKHLDLYLKHFKNKQLVANDDLKLNNRIIRVDEGGNVSQLEYYTKKGIGVNDDSIDCNPGTSINDGNEAYTGYVIDEDTDHPSEVWENVPISLENHFGRAPTENLLKAINNCHASYARIHFSPDSYLATGLIEQMTLRLGYRLTFTEVQVSDLVMGKTTTIKFKMKNTGAAPCYKGGNPTFYIVDSLGSILCEAVSDFDVKNLKVDADVENTPEFSGEAKMQLPDRFYDDQDGRYYLAVAVTVPQQNGSIIEHVPYYNLPLDNRDEQGRKLYNIATFNIGEVY